MPKIVVTEENIVRIIHLINTWNGKLTWDQLCHSVSETLKISNVTRQTLSSYKEIQTAYSQRKNLLRNKDSSYQRVNTNIEFLINQISTLESELSIAQKTIEQYKQLFVRWQYNAYIHGIRIESLDDAIDMLDKPLLEINRRTGGS